MPSEHRRPETFAADKILVGFWMLLAAIPLLIGIYDLLKMGPRRDLLEMVALVALAPLAILIFASRFRASFADHAFVYRRWGRTISVPYTDIDHISIANRTPIYKAAVGTFLVTHDGKHLPFWPKLFPRRAVERFMTLGEVRCS